jgi:FKBP-type peptidyl-prolyl cis-trans isomerase 2
MSIKKGDTIKIEYVGTLDDGIVFDSTEKTGEPLEFEVGTQKVLESFENEIIGMEVGEEKEFKLSSEDAYGDYNKELTKDLPRDQLPEGLEIDVDMILVMSMPNGMQMAAKIVELTDETVTIDLNHPLAGQSLNFKVKIVEIVT